jgi:hypothetical protein
LVGSSGVNQTYVGVRHFLFLLRAPRCPPAGASAARHAISPPTRSACIHDGRNFAAAAAEDFPGFFVVVGVFKLTVKRNSQKHDSRSSEKTTSDFLYKSFIFSQLFCK